MTVTIPALEACEFVIGETADKWAGRCYEISCKFVDAGLVPGGVAVYGHWLGPVHPNSHFGKLPTSRAPFVRHGWIYVEKSDTVVDPTRWTFDARPPSIFVGRVPDGDGLDPCEDCGLIEEEHGDDGVDDNCGDYHAERWPYDEGGNEIRAAFQSEPPVPRPEEVRLPFRVEGSTAMHLRKLLRQADISALTERQLLWLANLAYPVLGTPEMVAATYEAICAAGDEPGARFNRFIELIPLDNRKKAAREGGFARE